MSEGSPTTYRESSRGGKRHEAAQSVVSIPSYFPQSVCFEVCACVESERKRAIGNLDHRVLCDRRDGLESAPHLFNAARNVLVKQNGEVCFLGLTSPRVDPAGDIPGQKAEPLEHDSVSQRSYFTLVTSEYWT